MILGNEAANFEGVARSGRESLQCYIERKYYKPGKGIDSNKGIITKASITIPNFSTSSQYRLYEIEVWGAIPVMRQHLNPTSIIITLFTVTDEKKVGISKVKTEYISTKTHLYNVEDVEKLIERLMNNYKNGRVLLSYNHKRKVEVWGLAPRVVGRSLYYKQVKGILLFEKKSLTKVPAEAKPAILHANPKLIPSKIDFGNYILESWGSAIRRRRYSYVAFDKGTEAWVEKVCRQVTM